MDEILVTMRKKHEFPNIWCIKLEEKQLLPLHGIDHVLVEFDESVDGSFTNFQGGKVGKEVVADKEAEEYLQQV